MTQALIARAEADIHAPVSAVWDALINPETIKKYMWGTNVESDWRVGSSITWSGEWEGKPYKDVGTILSLEEEREISYSHESPGKDGEPKVHTVTIKLSGDDEQTHLVLTQDGSLTEDERAKSEANWNMMLGELKRVVERE